MYVIVIVKGLISGLDFYLIMEITIYSQQKEHLLLNCREGTLI